MGRKARPEAVCWGARVFASAFLTILVVQACGGSSSPTQPTQPTRPTEPTADVAGTWQVITRSSVTGASPYFSLVLTQNGASVSGTFSCSAVGCISPNGTVSGTVSGSSITARLVFQAGQCDTFNGTLSGPFISGNYGCSVSAGNDNGTWSAARTSSLCVPALVAPANDAVLDNGRADTRDTIDWDFDWSDCPGATEYLLSVKNDKAIFEVILELVPQSSLRSVECGAYIGEQGRFNWRWRVSAKYGEFWGDWSPERVFSVESPETDPPQTCG